MPDNVIALEPDSLTMRQKLEGMAYNFERRERAVDRRYALTEFLNDSNEMHRAVIAELQKMRGL